MHLERRVVDAASDWALVTGVQHARVIVDGASIEIVAVSSKHDNEWRIQAAVDLPAAPVE